MLQINKRSKGSGDSSNRPDTVLFETLRNITGIMNRQRPIAVVVFICCFALNGWGSIIIDKRKLQLFQKESILERNNDEHATTKTQINAIQCLLNSNVDIIQGKLDYASLSELLVNLSELLVKNLALKKLRFG